MLALRYPQQTWLEKIPASLKTADKKVLSGPYDALDDCVQAIHLQNSA